MPHPQSKPISTRLRRRLFPIAALGIALLAACGLAEVGLRICGYGRAYTNPMGSFFEPDALTGCHGKPNFVGRFRRADFDAHVEHDENGFRRTEAGDPSVGPPKHDLYVLGDSFVWGYGVGQHDLLTNQLARLMAGYRIHNVGLIGSGTLIEYVLFQHYIQDQLKPGDTVVLVFFGNDFGDNIGQHNSDRLYAKMVDGQIELVPPPQVETLKHQWKNRMKDASCLFNLATYCIDRFQQARNAGGVYTKGQRLVIPAETIRRESSDDGPAVRITRHYLDELKKACIEKQVRFLVTYVPGQAELQEDDISATSDLSEPEEVAYRRAFDRAVGALSLETIDLMAPMVAAKKSGRFARMTFARDFHWNAAGHTIAAETIAAEIARRDK